MILSSEQEKVMLSESDKILCLAGGGSGKTRTMIARMVDLINNREVSPYEILSFSFTRKSAGEISKRLEKEIGSQAHKIRTGTIHGLALKFLQTYGELVGLRPDKITIYGSWEEQFLLKEVAMELGFHTGKAWKKVKKGEVDAAFNLFYTTGAINPDSHKENSLMNAFFARCKENNALTYGTILTTFLQLIPKISQYLNLCHVLVDEVQDLDPLQWEIINQLCKCTGASLFAIGDIRQSIFSFRGADPEYLLRNQHLFDVYNLRDNYRSVGPIVDAANILISHNPMDLGEGMIAIREEFGMINVLPDMDSDRLVGLCAFYQNQNCAVLARNHYLLKKLSRLLDEAGIKHEYIGKKTGLVRSENFRRFHSFLKLIVNPFDNFSFLLIKDYLGISKEEYADIRMDATVEMDSHFNIWRETFTTLNEWEMVFKQSEPGDMDTVIDWMKDIDFNFDTEEIFTFVYSWILENPAGTISQYLNWLATFDIQDEIKDENDGLQLMTAHAAKGLEFSTVILAGLNDGIFPDSRAIEENDLTSEIRLMYVAMTRAEDQLIFTSRPAEDKYGKKSPVSRFIEWSL